MHAEREPTLRRLFELPEERAAGPNCDGLKFGGLGTAFLMTTACENGLADRLG